MSVLDWKGCKSSSSSKLWNTIVNFNQLKHNFPTTKLWLENAEWLVTLLNHEPEWLVSRKVNIKP